jgi:hypothetical protein
MKVEVFFIIKTYPNGLTKIESGPYFSHMDALIAKEDCVLPVFENDYKIVRTELEMELA